MKNIRSFKSFKINEGYWPIGVAIYKVAEDAMESSDVGEVAESIYELLEDAGKKIDRNQKGNPFGSLANGVHNTAKELISCKDLEEAFEKLSKFVDMAMGSAG